MLLLKSYIGVARNETGSSRFPKIAIQKVFRDDDMSAGQRDVTEVPGPRPGG